MGENATSFKAHEAYAAELVRNLNSTENRYLVAFGFSVGLIAGGFVGWNQEMSRTEKLFSSHSARIKELETKINYVLESQHKTYSRDDALTSIRIVQKGSGSRKKRKKRCIEQ